MTDHSDDPFFAELDRALEGVKEKEDLLKRKRKIRADLGPNRHVPAGHRERLTAELREIGEKLEQILWLPQASVAMFSIQHCDNCASDHSMFLSHMQRQVTSAGVHCSRFVRVPKPDPTLPKEVIKQYTVTHVCVDCCEEFGYDFAGGQVKLATNSEPFAVSMKYQQEEIES